MLTQRLCKGLPVLLAALLLLPPGAKAEDLVTVYNLARQNDPKFRAAESNYLAGRQKLPQARATLMPTINARAARDRNDTDTVTDAFIPGRPSGRFEFSSSEYSLSLSQPVYNGVVFAGLKQAKAEVRRAEADYAAAGQDMILRVAEAYFGQLAAQDNLDFARAEKRVIRRQLESAEGRLKVGLTTITDVHDARARYEIASAQEIEADNQLQDKREALRELTGSAPGTLSAVGTAMPLVTPEPADINQWVEQSVAQNYPLLAKRESAESAREEVKRLQAGHYPTLDLVGTRTRNDADGSITGTGIRSDNTVVGLQLNVPLSRRARQRARRGSGASLRRRAAGTRGEPAPDRAHHARRLSRCGGRRGQSHGAVAGGDGQRIRAGGQNRGLCGRRQHESRSAGCQPRPVPRQARPGRGTV